MTQRLAVVVAHPDDDTFSCAGTVALHAKDPAFRFVLVHATRGEAGMISDPALATRETLGAVRQEEDRRSWSVLGRLPDRHEWLDYPDGGVADATFDELVSRIAAVLREERPDVVVTFGPDGVTGHPDHVTVGRAATAGFHAGREEGGSGFHRLIYTAIPQSLIDRWNAERVAEGKDPWDPERIFDPRGVADESIGLAVDTSAVAPRILAALREHRTQADDVASVSEDDLGREYGVVAWQARVGGTMLADVFDGLVP
jgi:LmbE family N-acetylglucosaminyl deacetylase